MYAYSSKVQHSFRLNKIKFLTQIPNKTKVSYYFTLCDIVNLVKYC